MTYRAWFCESCGHGQKIRDNVWDCPGCGKEGCDGCFWMYAHCKPCCEGKSDEALRLAANAKGFDFAPLEPFESGVTAPAVATAPESATPAHARENEAAESRLSLLGGGEKQ